MATRRNLIAGASVSLAALVAPGTAAREAGPAKAEELDGELLACCARGHALEAQAAVMVASSPPVAHCPVWAAADDLQDEAYRLWDRAAEIPARTPEGMQAKARFVLARLEDEGVASALALSLARDVLGKA
jgi:hypothetical protein